MSEDSLRAQAEIVYYLEDSDERCDQCGQAADVYFYARDNFSTFRCRDCDDQSHGSKAL